MFKVGDKIRLKAYQKYGRVCKVMLVMDDGSVWIDSESPDTIHRVKEQDQWELVPHEWKVGARCIHAFNRVNGTVIGIHEDWLCVVCDGPEQKPYAYASTAWTYVEGK